MKRRLFNLLTACSVLLSVAACVLWVRSYLALDQVGRRTVRHTSGRWFDQSFRGVVSSGGGLVLLAADDRQALAGLRSANVVPPPPSESLGWLDGAAGWELDYRPHSAPALGFELRHTFTGTGNVSLQQQDWRWLRVPYWVVAVGAATLPATRGAAGVRRRRAERRRGAATCPRCGYDLRATPARCPECGTPTCGAGILPAGR